MDSFALYKPPFSDCAVIVLQSHSFVNFVAASYGDQDDATASCTDSVVNGNSLIASPVFLPESQTHPEE